MTDSSVPMPPATSHTTAPSGHGYTPAMARALISVAWRMVAANTLCSSGCSAYQSHTDIPCTDSNALRPVRTLSARPLQASTVDRIPL